MAKFMEKGSGGYSNARNSKDVTRREAIQRLISTRKAEGPASKLEPPMTKSAARNKFGRVSP